MIYEVRTYRLAVGSTNEAIKRFGEAYEYRKKYSELAAFFYTEIGPLNQIVHMWAYEDLKERSERRAKLAADPRWQEMLPKNRPLIVDQESKILIPAPFSPIP